jgi:transporter family-2 protein
MISMEALAIPLLLFVGSLLALQAGANVQLSGAVGSPIGASTLQLAIAAGLLLALTVAAVTLGAFSALADAEPAHLWGGIGSAVYITAGILLFPRVGALVAVGLFIAGQMGRLAPARRIGVGSASSASRSGCRRSRARSPWSPARG